MGPDRGSWRSHGGKGPVNLAIVTSKLWIPNSRHYGHLISTARKPLSLSFSYLQMKVSLGSTGKDNGTLLQLFLNDGVYWDGSSYIALTANIGHQPVGNQNDIFWSLPAKKGNDGQDATGGGEGTVVTSASPYSGSNNQVLAQAIRDIDASRQDPNCHYWIKQLIAGVQQPDGKYLYVIDIRFHNPGIANPVGDAQFLLLNTTVAQRYSGLTYLNLGNTNPGIWGLYIHRLFGTCTRRGLSKCKL